MSTATSTSAAVVSAGQIRLKRPRSPPGELLSRHKIHVSRRDWQTANKKGRGIFSEKISRGPFSNLKIGKLAQQGAEKIAA
jgi:hypothetical protein